MLNCLSWSLRDTKNDPIVESMNVTNISHRDLKVDIRDVIISFIERKRNAIIVTPFI